MFFFKWLVNFNRKIVKNFVYYSNKHFNISDYYINYDFKHKVNFLYKSNKVKKILEVGCSDRPFLENNDKIIYNGLDIDESVNSEKYFDKFIIQSVEDKINENYDLIFSKYVMEHVENNSQAFHNMYDSLNKDGIMIHIYPMGFHPYSIITRLIPNFMVRILIPILRPGTENVTGYKTFYDLGSFYYLEKFLKENKFNYDTKYYYNADDYFAFFFPLGIFMYLFDRLSSLLNLKIFASGVKLIIKK